MRHFSLLALAALAVAAPSPRPGTQKISYNRRSVTNTDGTVNEAALVDSLIRTVAKYTRVSLSPDIFSLGKRATGNVPLTDQVEDSEDDLYYGTGTVGGQSFTIDFDTGSADLFVPGPNCGTANGCTGTPYANTGADQGTTTSVTYGSGNIAGEDYKDTVTVGGLTVADQGFISLTTAAGFSGSNASSLMGMGFSTIAQTGYKTFFENLMAQGSVTSNEFSFYLGRATSGTQGASEMTLGGVDTSLFTGTPYAVPVTTQGYWQVALDGATVNGETALLAAGQAAIDTGTTVVLAPTVAAATIFAAIPGSVPLPLLASGSLTITLWAYPCNISSSYVPAITFNGESFAINPLDFELGTLAEGGGLLTLLADVLGIVPLIGEYCIAGLGSADLDPTQNLWVVGDVFLKNWYSIYSYDGPSVSFAPAVNNQ